MTSPMLTLGFSFGTVPARQFFCILRSAPHARKGFLTGDVLMEHKPAVLQNDTRRGYVTGCSMRQWPGYFSLAYSALACSEWKGFFAGDVLMEHKLAWFQNDTRRGQRAGARAGWTVKDCSMRNSSIVSLVTRSCSPRVST